MYNRFGDIKYGLFTLTLPNIVSRQFLKISPYVWELMARVIQRPTLQNMVSIFFSWKLLQVQDMAQESDERRNSVSKRLTASAIDIRCEGSMCQHCRIILHRRSEISGRSGRGGLRPITIACFAAISISSENGGCPARICLE